MNRRFVYMTLAYVVPSFLLGFVWHLVLFKSYYESLRIYRPDVIIPFGFSSMILQGAIFAWAYPRVLATPARMTSAIRFAASAALLSWTFTTLAVGAKHAMTSVGGFVTIETAYTIVQFALVAPLLALAARARVPSAQAAMG